MNNTSDISVDVYGDFACFTQPDAKIERVSYDIITPSAARGILNAIYMKPNEFFYEIRQIEVMKPIKRISMKRNEVKVKASYKKGEILPIDTIKERTQRTTIYLKDVYYRIHADIHVRDDLHNPRVNRKGIISQFNHRIKKGKCFFQPYLGLSECVSDFLEPDETMQPLNISKDCGIMLYDVFDIDDNVPLSTDEKAPSGHTNIRFYHPYMINGIVNVPEYNSRELFTLNSDKK